jgi:hypothetical protein
MQIRKLEYNDLPLKYVRTTHKISYATNWLNWFESIDKNMFIM